MATGTTEPTATATVLPASYAQQRMWFLERFEGGAVYNVPLALRLRGPLDGDALERALDALVERHESLRTVFTLIDGVPHQVIRPSRPFPLEMVDVSGAPRPEERAIELSCAHARRRFDLSAEVAFRAMLIELGSDDHVLSLTLHHIITDAWSMGVLGRELSELYGGFRNGDTVELPELQVQYADYAVWQQQWIEGGGLDRQVEYWERQLAGAPPLLELPTDHPRPPRQSFRGATERTMLPLELMERVRAVGERESATMFMTLLAAFAALLSRYSGKQEVVVASPVANRNRVELERVIGLFVNTLPLRVDLEHDPSFAELVGRVRELALGAFSNQDLPFEQLVERLNPERHLSHAPIAQVLFVVQNAVERPVRWPGLEQERLQTDRGTAKFDLTFFASETPEGLRLSLEYCTDLFEPATAARMLQHYRVLLEAAVADPERPVGELRLLGAGEEQLVVETWNDTAVRYPLERLRCVHELVAEQARLTPEATALAAGATSLTYAQLEAGANRLARRLRELGVGRGVVAAICAERSAEMAVAVLAVLKAGGAYAPIDPHYPDQRIAFMLADTDTPVLLTQRHLVAALPAHRAQVVCLDSDVDLLAPGDEEPVSGGATLDDVAYVIYTSGSTGQPKGVAMSHRPLANLLAWQLDQGRDPGSPPAADRTLQFASLSFDVAFQELFSTWCAGGAVKLIEDEVRRDSEALLAFIREHRVERLFLPFVALHNLCEAAEYLGFGCPSLREVITAGEQLKTTDAIREFFARHPDCTLVNQYGPTESHVVTAYALTGTPARWPALPPIGRPIANARIYLLDPHLRPVPIGVPGELYLGGVSLARGYLGRDQLTAERFIADPFSSAAQARMYRTGDLGRYQPDGNIEYLGRADDQVKVRGFRVEPGEIEAALRERPEIREALVVARGDGGESRLVAYVIGEQGGVAVDELRATLRRSLPEYMIPSGFAFLDEFPLTPNGKVDRARLESTPLTEEHQGRALVPPRTETEASLAAIWCKLLAVEEIGVYDNFFELGGHSLMAVRLFSEIERKLDARLPLSSLFETATVAGQATLVERERREEIHWGSLVELRSGNGQLPLFLIGWAGGEVLPYRDLVANLDESLPVFGLRAPGVDGRGEPRATVERLAEHYVNEIRRVQPHGPYRLGGFCFSGLVAYEMARQLLEQGEAISTLALIDAYPYNPPRRRRAREVGRVQVEALKGVGAVGTRRWMRDRLAGLRGHAHRALYLKLGPRAYELLAERRLEHRLPRRPWNLVLIASNLARRRYVPEPLDVRIEFYRAQRAPDPGPTPWEGLAAQGVELRQIVAADIDHDGMMHEPHVRMLARELMRDLSRSRHRPRHGNGRVNGAGR